ncbi:uncharacterized protein [Watersipora subatra]|uniref:uncharacterized protein n=1 Tax=Watersipora subatra TaxID=2589382 RepID=UPI00355C1325
MPTINKFDKLPSIAGLTEKPAPVRSGKPLKEHVKICYRSDLYMKEQRKNVVLFQEQLRQALLDLKTAKASSLQFHVDQVKQLKIKSDEMIILLQICGKINRELAHARQDLLSAVDSGADSGLINKRRKRVQWLENKLEQIIIKHSPAREDEVADGMHSDADFGVRYSDMGNNSRLDKSAMSSLPVDMSRLPTANSDDRLNTAATSTSLPQLSMNREVPEEIIGANLSSNRLVLPEVPEAIDHDVPESTAGTLIVSPIAAGQRATQSKLSFREPLASEQELLAHGRETTQHEDQEMESVSDDDENYDDEDDGGEEDSEPDIISRTGNKSQSEMSVVSSLFTDVTDEGTRRTRRSSRRMDPQSPSKSKLSKEQMVKEASKVTLVSPEPETTYSDVRGCSSPDRSDICSLSSMSIDIVTPGNNECAKSAVPFVSFFFQSLQMVDEPSADDYWMSEHHRVEFSALRPYLNELDPNSLHQVGIAVPGNYVNKPPSGRKVELPWREAEDNRDINREALDRLSRQLISMQEKVYEEAIKSVDSMGHRLATRASKRDLPSMAKPVGRSAMSSRQITQQTATSLPAMPEQSDESQNRYTPVVRLKYYSKEIPKAKTLAISRVNRDKSYPQPLSTYVFPDTEGGLAPDRLVNQGSLHNDTKLVIYRPATRKRMEFAEEKQMANVTQSVPTLETEKTMTSNVSLRAASKAAMALGAMKLVRNQTPRAAHVGPKWDRVQYLFQTSLKSKFVEERQHAAKQLGLLACPDADVFDALKSAIVTDSDERVQYESTKALVRLGCLEDELVQILVDYLIVGNEEVRLDVMKTIGEIKGIAFINKSMPSFDELIKVLAHLCKNTSIDDCVSFEAAITFGTICVKNIQAVEKMTHYLNNGNDTHKKALALRILIKQFNESNWNLVEVVLKQFTRSPVWSHRQEAAQLLQHLGRKHTCDMSEHEEHVYSILERRLWDDSVEMVRLEAANTLGVLEMYTRAAETVVKRLSDLDPTMRAHAVTSLGTLGIKQPKVLRVLTEMLELDPSDNVRREVIRAFGSLKISDKKIIRLIRERERGDGILATEAKNVLKILDSL